MKNSVAIAWSSASLSVEDRQRLLHSRICGRRRQFYSSSTSGRA